MMHFINSEEDGVLLGDLKDAGVLDPGTIERIHEAMGRPESGSLTEFFLAGAEFIPEKPWLYWLIRRHSCHRFGRVTWLAEDEAWAGDPVPKDANLPYRQTPEGALLIAVLRPDFLAATAKRLAPRTLLWAAGTPVELRDLRDARRKARSSPVGANLR
jgi:hypothetical protein